MKITHERCERGKQKEKENALTCEFETLDSRMHIDNGLPDPADSIEDCEHGAERKEANVQGAKPVADKGWCERENNSRFSKLESFMNRTTTTRTDPPTRHQAGLEPSGFFLFFDM